MSKRTSYMIGIGAVAVVGVIILAHHLWSAVDSTQRSATAVAAQILTAVSDGWQVDRIQAMCTRDYGAAFAGPQAATQRAWFVENLGRAVSHTVTGWEVTADTASGNTKARLSLNAQFECHSAEGEMTLLREGDAWKLDKLELKVHMNSPGARSASGNAGP